MSINKELEQYRIDIDDIDTQILNLLERRFDIIRAVGHLKSEQDIEIIQSTRAADVIERTTQLAKDKNIPQSLIKSFYESMIDEAHNIEFAIKKTKA